MSPIRVPVLIVGGGLSGLTTAVMLAWRGIPAMLVERHASPSAGPRARSVNFRSMELLRVAGLEPELIRAGGRAASDFSIIIAESVMGRELKTILTRGAWDTTNLSPARMSGAGQDCVEPILRQHAEALGADVRYATQLTSFEQDADGVTAVIRDVRSGTEAQVRADYLVAADGHRSPVRERLGIEAHGEGTVSNHIAVLFEADLSGALRGRGLALYYLQNPGFAGTFINTDVPNRALITVEYDPATARPEDFDAQRCIQLVRAAVGIPELQVNILEIQPWEMAARMADRYGSGRAFLIGDAAHTMPPTGGLGGQTAIQDGYDLAWKLAMVLHRQAGPGLLTTYESERKPVADMTVALQMANYVERLRPDRKDLAAAAAQYDYLGVAFGYRYRSSAILEESPADTDLTENPDRPTGRPGSRGPHVWFEHKGARISSIDLIGRDFLLLAGSEGSPWARAAITLAHRSRVPVCVYRIGTDLIDVDGAWATRYGVTPRGAVLLRPDGYIAWRSRESDSSPMNALSEVFARVLALPIGTPAERGFEMTGSRHNEVEWALRWLADDPA